MKAEWVKGWRGGGSGGGTKTAEREERTPGPNVGAHWTEELD